jgi:hypothetical protein
MAVNNCFEINLILINLNIDCKLIALSAEQRITNFDCGDADSLVFMGEEQSYYKKCLTLRP